LEHPGPMVHSQADRTGRKWAQNSARFAPQAQPPQLGLYRQR
jgi:hypothetical protein